MAVGGPRCARCRRRLAIATRKDNLPAKAAGKPRTTAKPKADAPPKAAPKAKSPAGSGASGKPKPATRRKVAPKTQPPETAQAESIVEAPSTGAASADDSASIVDRAVTLIERMRSEEIGRLDPVPDQESPCAFSYPDANDILQMPTGREVAVLQTLADKGILSAQETATVPLCPYCHTYAMRVERTCPECQGTSVHRTTMIHHFRCGNVSAEETYVEGRDLVCPKCSRRLLHLGVDYERPSEGWLCADCGRIVPAPALRYRSLTCGRSIPVGDELERTVYSYTLSMDGAGLVDEQHLRVALQEVGLVDALTGLPGVGTIERALELEQLRADRYGTTFSLALIRLANGRELEKRFGGAAVSRVMKTIGAILRESMRRVDTVGRYGQYLFAVILPETDRPGAGIATAKSADAIERYLHASERETIMREARIQTEILPTRPSKELLGKP